MIALCLGQALSTPTDTCRVGKGQQQQSQPRCLVAAGQVRGGHAACLTLRVVAAAACHDGSLLIVVAAVEKQQGPERG